MAFNVGAIVSKMELNVDQWKTSVETVKLDTKTLAGTIQKNAARIKSLGKAITGVGIAITGVTGLMVKFAMDAQESENLFRESMGTMADAAYQWSTALSKSLGVNQFEIRKTVGTFNVMLASMGASTQGAYNMSTALTQLGYDMASFYNLRTEEAFLKLSAGIAGETEPLKRLGILINETTIKTWALNNGMIREGEQMTELQKVQARYNVIMEQTTKAQGDLVRTKDSLTNLIRRMTSSFQELFVLLGTNLIPVLSRYTAKIVNVLASVKDWVQVHEQLASKLVLSVAALGAFALVLGPILIMLPGVVIAINAMSGALIPLAVAAVGVYFAFKYWDTVEQILLSLSQVVSETISTIAQKLAEFITTLAQFPSPFRRSLEEMSAGLREFADGMAENANIAAVALEDSINRQSEGIDDFADKVKTKMEEVGLAVSGAFGGGVSSPEADTGGFASLSGADMWNQISIGIDEAVNKVGQYKDAIKYAKGELGQLIQMKRNAKVDMVKIWQDVGTSIQQNLNQAMTDLILQTKSAKEAFADFGKAMLSTIVGIITKIISSMIAAAITEKLIATTIGTTQAALTPGLATNAMLMSIISYGAADVAGIAGMTAAMAAAQGIAALGKSVQGSYLDGTDYVPQTGIYRLHEGEQVTPKASTEESINQDIIIYNMITPEAVAQSMSGSEGERAIVNVIDRNSLRNGVVRRNVTRR